MKPEYFYDHTAFKKCTGKFLPEITVEAGATFTVDKVPTSYTKKIIMRVHRCLTNTY